MIWAETAAPLFLDADALRLLRIARFTPADGLTITGTLRRSTRAQPYALHNSLQAVDDTGSIRGSYDKFHLVPFGEYMPLRSFLGLTKLTAGTVDFSPGDGLQTLRLPGLPPVGPLICYEVIFPGNVAAADDRPGWLLNLTNDGWYGISSGPYQHFAAARLRAVEEGLPLVRVAGTGISAIVDGYGRIIARLGLGEEGVVDGPLPSALASLTPYGQFGDRITLLMVAFVGVVGWWLDWRHRKARIHA